MDPRDELLGRVCVERAWVNLDQLAGCVAECRGGAPLSQVLLRKRLIPEDELGALRAEIARALNHGSDPAQDLQEDLRLAQSLRDAGLLTRAQLEKALELEGKLRGKAGAPRLREILLEKQFVSFAALGEALQAMRKPGTPVICRSCQASSVLPRYDPGRVYLCKACTGELVPLAEYRPPPPPPVEAPVRIDEGFGKYKVDDEIGRGAVGVVYKAWDESEKRWVALKVVKDSSRLEETARFRREVEIARVLHHPNIVALYEVTRAGDKHLIAMEFIDGKILAGQQLPAERSAEIIAMLAHAVQYAHSRNVIHRDIKPQNIMIDRSGKPYLMDFGLAKSTGSASSITSIGMAMGTPSYMSPEQALGKTARIDRRSDVYSLGAVLYTLVTGSPPFRGASPMDTLKKVVSEDLTPPSRIVAGLPRPLEQIIFKCMEKDKTQRYPSAKHLADDLERFLRSEPPQL